MTTDDVLTGVALIMVFAVGSQLLASVLRIPSLIVMLPVGFAASVGTGVAGGVVGAAALWALFRVVRPGEVLGTTAQLATVIGVAVGCDILRDDSGLIAAVPAPAIDGRPSRERVP